LGRPGRDAELLSEILRSAARLSEVQRNGYPRFARSGIVAAAVEKDLNLTGSAARRVSAALRRDHGDVDWKSLAHLRRSSSTKGQKTGVREMWGELELVAKSQPTLERIVIDLWPEEADKSFQDTPMDQLHRRIGSRERNQTSGSDR
jgi:uncharacterized protein with HEPN domain